MIPAAFEYEVADSVEGAAGLLREGGEDAKLLAGGQSLLPLMKTRLARPSLLVDIARVPGLAGVRDAGGHLAVGAMTRYIDLHTNPLVQEHCPLLAHTAGEVGVMQVRHAGTIGGSVAHGDPASDLAGVLLAYDAEIVARGAGGERVIPASKMFVGFLETALASDEILTEIRVPKAGAERWAYLKFRRRSQDWAVVGVAALVRGGNGTIDSARVGLVNMADRPLRARAAEAALVGASPASVETAAAAADEGTAPPDDTFASADFRRHLARVLVGRAVTEALAR